MEEATNYSCFPKWSDELSHALICHTLASIDRSTMSSEAYSELIDYINYDSPLSAMNIEQHLPQYQPQPPLSFYPSLVHNPPAPVQPPSYMPYYPQVPQQSYGYIPIYYPMQQYILVRDERSDDYEDMLDLQERMGRVNVGLSEETIFNNLKTSRANIACKDIEEGGEICAVCQDEYKVKEIIGTLQCGHRYHANCIKEWLLRKNECPICKAKALIA